MPDIEYLNNLDTSLYIANNSVITHTEAPQTAKLTCEWLCQSFVDLLLSQCVPHERQNTNPYRLI